MKILKAIMLSLVTTFALTSCDSDNEQTMRYSYDFNVSYVTDMNANTLMGTELEGAKYIMDFDLTDGVVDITVSDLRLSQNSGPISLKIERASYDFVNGATVVNVANATSIYNGTHNISNFRFSQTMRGIDKMGKIVVYYSISYVVDNRYSVIAVQDEAYLPGTTTVTSNATGELVKTGTDPYYNYDLDRESGTADITAYFLQDDERTYLELEFEDLPYELGTTGIIINVEGSFTAKQYSSMSSTPFVAKAIYMNSRFDSSTEIRILTEENSYTANLTYAPTTAPLN